VRFLSRIQPPFGAGSMVPILMRGRWPWARWTTHAFH